VWVALTLLVAGMTLSLLFREYIEHRFDILLQEHLTHLIAGTEMSAEGRLGLTWTPPDPYFRRPGSGHYWEIKQGGQTLARSASLEGRRLAVDRLPAGEASEIQPLLGPAGEVLRAAVKREPFPGVRVPLVFVVAGPAADVENDVRAFGNSLALTLAVLGCGLLLAILFQVRFGLQPLREVQSALGDIRKGKAQRLDGHYPVEIGLVVHELNALLEYNADLLERARTLAGNLAHALKNPLTVIRNEARTIDDEAGRVIRDQTQAMASSIDQHLSRARAAGGAASLGARADVRAIVEDLRFSMQTLYRERGLDIELSGLDGCWYRGEAQDLEEMLGNLLDNACKWANSRVLVTGECSAERLVIRVEDDGPGIPEEHKAKVLRRGQRLDESVPGSGLGLAIVSDIAGLYRGSLILGRAPGGGLSACLELPAADRDGV
jgi:signal transduction histidine kinase